VTTWTPEIATRGGPVYLSIADAIAEDLGTGRLAPGARLPTHRDLAGRLGVTVGTVSRAYAEAARRGLVSGEVGRGTFVRARFGDVVPAPSAGEPSVVDLRMNHPPPPPGGLRAVLQATLSGVASRPDLAGLMAYPPGAGAASHRSAGADWIRRSGHDVRAEDVLVCSGGQHAMTIVFASLLKAGDLVLTESLTYPGMRTLAALLHLRLQGLAMDEHGVKPEALDAACRGGGAKALYCLPTIQNPTAAVVPAERRREIARIAGSHGLVVVEDDIHALLPRPPLAPISSFAPEISYYVTSTSKSLAPGLRVGYLAAPPGTAERMAAAIRATTWMAAPLLAEIASSWIKDGTADRVLEGRRAEAAARQEIARTTLAGARYQAHPFGYHLWLGLKEPWTGEAFAAHALHRGVAVTPSGVFAVGHGPPPAAVRVCLGGPRSRAELEKGLRLLIEAVETPPDRSASGIL